LTSPSERGYDIGMNLKEDLIAKAEAHCATLGISKARLSTIVVNDGKFFERLARGGSCTLSTYEKFMAHFQGRAALPDAEAR